jgi:hypothetical protein
VRVSRRASLVLMVDSEEPWTLKWWWQHGAHHALSALQLLKLLGRLFPPSLVSPLKGVRVGLFLNHPMNPSDRFETGLPVCFSACLSDLRRRHHYWVYLLTNLPFHSSGLEC